VFSYPAKVETEYEDVDEAEYRPCIQGRADDRCRECDSDGRGGVVFGTQSEVLQRLQDKARNEQRATAGAEPSVTRYVLGGA
jgi:hypothetical protein